MLVAISILIGLLLVWAMIHAYQSTRDPLHPLIYLCPLFIYAYAFKPILMKSTGMLDEWFPGDEGLLFVQAVNFAALAAFVAGCLKVTSTFSARSALTKSPLTLTPAARATLFKLGFVFGTIAVLAYWYMIIGVGGFLSAYGRSYGGGRAESGYIGEAPLLAFPAIVLLLMAWKDQPKTLSRVALILLFASPHLLQGLLGARRGPTFLIMAALLVSHFVISNKRPKLTWVLTSVFALGTLILLLIANRDRIYLGSENLAFDPTAMQQRLLVSQGTLGTGEDWSCGSGAMLTAWKHGVHHWGTRFAVILFVRPIPKQIWPDKYEDLGVAWMQTQEDKFGCTDNEWLSAVGWVPPAGSAAGFITDLFLEFSFGVVIACYGFGYLYGYLWKRAIISSGLWALLYIFAIILSVYVPTQSMSAWFHRFLLMSVPTIFMWRWFIAPTMKTSHAMRSGTTISQPRAKYRPGGRPAVQVGEAS